MKKIVSFFIALIFALSFNNFLNVEASENVDLNLGITGGSLSMNLDSLIAINLSPISIDNLTLSNQESKTLFHNFSVTDSTGSGSGWNVQVTSSQFVDGANTLPANRTFVSGDVLSLDPDITNLAPGKNTLTDGIPTSIVSATSGKGLGNFNFSGLDVGFDLLTTDVNNLKIGSYISTFTVGVVTGP
jgi:hypothetical protein